MRLVASSIFFASILSSTLAQEDSAPTSATAPTAIGTGSESSVVTHGVTVGIVGRLARSKPHEEESDIGFGGRDSTPSYQTPYKLLKAILFVWSLVTAQ